MNALLKSSIHWLFVLIAVAVAMDHRRFNPMGSRAYNAIMLLVISMIASGTFNRYHSIST